MIRKLFRIYRTFGPHLMSYTKWFAIGYTGLAAMVLFKLVQPWPLKFILDNILLAKPMPSFLAGINDALGSNQLYLLTILCVATVVIAALEGFAAFMNKYYLSAAGHSVTNDIRHRVFDHLLVLPPAFHQTRKSGDLIVRLTSDINSLKTLLISSFQRFVRHILTFASVICVMLWMDWRLTIVALLTVPFLYVLSVRLSEKVEVVTKKKRSKESEVASIVQETMSSMPVVKAYVREKSEKERFAGRSDESLEADLQKSKLVILFGRSVNVIAAIGMSFVVWFGAKRVLDGALSPGDLIVFIAYLKDLYRPIGGFSDLIMELVTSTVCGERVAELLEMDASVQDAPDAIKAPPFRGEVVFDHVTFGYRPEDAVLQDLSFRVQPGWTVALVGSSGAGKTTIVNLLLRFYDPSQGLILIDGQDLRRFQVKSLRKQISVVLQESVLFRRTIRENIAFGKPDATFDQIEVAASAAQAHDFIMKLPDSYETVLDERAENLSGGQRQRIALARAIIRDAPILILDEPVTGLDAITEEKLVETLNRLFENRTTFVIAHRLSTVKRADLILVVEEGLVTAQGTHDELLKQSSLYRNLYTLQDKPVIQESTS